MNKSVSLFGAPLSLPQINAAAAVRDYYVHPTTSMLTNYNNICILYIPDLIITHINSYIIFF